MLNQLKRFKVEEIANATAQTAGFAMRSPLSERHGGYEIVFHKNDGLDRFLVLAFSIQTANHYFTGLSAIAEDDLHAKRELTASFSVPAERFPTWIDSPAFGQALRDSFQAALLLHPVELKHQVAFANKPLAAFSANL